MNTLAPRADLARKIAALCHANSVLELVCGTYSNVLRLLPPPVIGDTELLDGWGAPREAILQVADMVAAEQLESTCA